MINGDGKGLTWAGEHTIQYIEDVLWKYTPETCIILLTNVIPINSIKKTLHEEIKSLDTSTNSVPNQQNSSF